LLSSVNPQAAAAIHSAPVKARLPGVGETVIYHMRQGYARSGKTRVPALVMGHGDRDTLSLLVMIDAGDFNDESLVDEIGIGREFHVWERVLPIHPAIDHLMGEIAALREIIQGLQASVERIEARPKLGRPRKAEEPEA
jgi:hypothetical protein